MSDPVGKDRSFRSVVKSSYSQAYARVFRSVPKGFSPAVITPVLFHDIQDIPFFLKVLKTLLELRPFISPDEFEEKVNSRKPLEKSYWLLTFDDGYLSSANAIKKAFEVFGIKSAFFVVPSWVGLSGEASRRFVIDQLKIAQPQEIECVQWQDVLELSEQGHRIGSHSLSHLRLAAIESEEILHREVVDSRKILEEKLTRQVKWFAFPFGDIHSINSAAMKLIHSSYQYCFSGVRGEIISGTSNYGFYRQSIDLGMDIDCILGEALGAYDLRYRSARQRLQELVSNEL